MASICFLYSFELHLKDETEISLEMGYQNILPQPMWKYTTYLERSFYYWKQERINSLCKYISRQNKLFSFLLTVL